MKVKTHRVWYIVSTKTLLLVLLCLSPLRTPTLAAQGIGETGVPRIAGGGQQTAAIEHIMSNAQALNVYRTVYETAFLPATTQMEAARVAKAAGFVMLVGRDTTLAVMDAERKEEFAVKVRNLLRSIDPAVSPLVDDFQWRAVEMMQFATAYDYLRGVTGTRDAAAEVALCTFANNAYRRLDQPIVARNNLTLKLAAAMGYTALVLRDSHTPLSDISRADMFALAMDHIHHTMWGYQSDSTGMYGYSEGPYYFRYAMMSVLPFFLAIDDLSSGGTLDFGSRSFPSPLREAKWQRLFEWIASLRLPDGSLPPFEDTYMRTWFPEVATVASIDPSLRSLDWRNVANGQPLSANALSNELNRTFDFRAEYLLFHTPDQYVPAPVLPSQLMPAAGYAVHRQGWDAGDTYFGVIAKNGIARTHRSPSGSGHKHANEGAFMLHAGGQPLIIEPGYHSSDQRDSLIYARNHNVLLVDGAGPDSTSWGSFLFGVDAFIQDTLANRDGGMNSVRTAYQSASVERGFYLPSWDMIALRDEASSDRRRSFTHQLHGNGNASNGSYTLNEATGVATWTSGDMRVSARVTAVGLEPEWNTVARLHAPSYRTFETHDALYSTLSLENVVFHTLLVPHNVSDEVVFSPLAGDPHVSAIRADVANRTMVSVVASSARMSRVVFPAIGAVYCNARAWQGILDSAGRPVVWMLDEGSTLERSTGRLVLSSPMPLRAHLRESDQGMDISVRDAAARELQVRVPFVPARIEGAVESWSMQGTMLRLRLPGPNADIRVVYSGTVTASESIAAAPASLRLDAPWPNPATRSAGASVTVRVSVPSGTSARLLLRDALGRTRVLVDDFRGDGEERLQSIPTHDLVPGMYFLRLEREDGGPAVQHSMVIL